MSANFSAKPNQGEVKPFDRADYPLANSERIQLMFGSCAIEVLENDPGIRVSSLYSNHEGARVNRTFAVVAYPRVIEHAFREEHDAIVSGQSIGTLFKERGWVLEKRHLYFGELDMQADLFETAAQASDRSIRPAIHVYTLVIKKLDSHFEYASIAEIHHPDFLRLDDLVKIYGPVDAGAASDHDRLHGFLTTVEKRIKAIVALRHQAQP
jgi:hypothetical protein